ncbi:hypothetical protein ACF09C_30140 [Streptomyces sp. NPDC014870]|uniref:hypothetical protein n=1 Tax=Streptomyces sp. NPDC014870 TaxID=3364925 RepID=UPI0037007889
MNGAPHLLGEDFSEYERILDDALRTLPDRPGLAGVAGRLNAEQLRTMALSARAVITAGAAVEYEHYVRVREEVRGSARSPRKSWDKVYSSSRSEVPAPSARPHPGTRSAATDDDARTGLGRRLGAAVLGAGQPGGRRISDGVAPSQWAGMSYRRRLLAALLGLRVRPAAPSASGASSPAPPERPVPARARAADGEAPFLESPTEPQAGLLTVLSVLAVLFSGAATALSFLVGLVLKLFSATSGVGRTMIGAGWIFGIVTVVALAVCTVGLLVTALRIRHPTSEAADYHEGGDDDEVARAREAWRHALLERGILPFLNDALAHEGAALPRPDASSPARRVPIIGYTGPDFTSPGEGRAPRPTFTSPDLTSPDFGGPEHQPE